MESRPSVYASREAAGQELAHKLQDLADREPIVFALVRGGVAVAAPIAQSLNAPMYPLIVRKIGHPQQPELAVGAIGPGGEVRLEESTLRITKTNPEDLQTIIEKEKAELKRRQDLLDHPGENEIKGNFAIVVDDGLATGSTAAVAGDYLRGHGAAHILLAIPVCPPEAKRRMLDVYDEVVCLQEIADFRSVGQWYTDFRQLADHDVIGLLQEQNPPGEPS
jgi:predicted phosphoribosyltransferase